MLSRVLETISRYDMLPPGARVVAAVSGGADSVCLLHVLHELFPQSLAGVAHFNHGWRAEASHEDERFVAGLAHHFNLPFHRAEAGPAAPGNLEQNARRARLSFFAGLETTVALGHTRDDQAETVLFRFLRGSGLAGLSGIAPTSKNIIRPLLDVTRAEVESFLRSRHIPWREDSTNLDPRFARNRIRHHLLPQLARDWNPQIAATLSRLADLAHEEEQYWEAEIDRLAAQQLIPRDNGIELLIQPLPPAVGRRLIRRAIALAKGDLRRIDHHHVEAVLNLKRSLRLPGLTVTRSFDWLRFASPTPTAPPQALEIGASGVYPSPDGLSKICVNVAQSDPCANLRVEECCICLPLVLRGWRPGDHYRPQGHSRDHKIQEMFQKARVPSWRRASWPILADRDQILWSRQFGAAEGSFVEVREITL
jgi:tRNA(Ile)-lysidine synthase